MDVPNLLSDGRSQGTRHHQAPLEATGQNRQYMTRQMTPSYTMQSNGNEFPMMGSYDGMADGSPQTSLSPTKFADPKHVSFELLLAQAPQARARLPMRVNIYQHDTTDSIITTVKNFYGLYERRGVCFEDGDGNTLIARYENFDHNMVVYVRVTEEDPDMGQYSPAPRQSQSPRRPRLDEPFQMLPPQNHQQPNRGMSRNAGRQSHSPQPGRGRRSASASANPKPRTRPPIKSRGSSSHGSFADTQGDTANVYSDSDGENESVTSSRRGKKEQVASAEISLDNIVEGGRRKRAKFDSSELPLFVPPQVPMTASVSSVSPQRRISSHNGASPFSYTNQHTFAYTHPLPSPQSYGQGDVSYPQGLSTPYSSNGQAHGHRTRTRGSAQYAPYRHSGNGGLILPTPDPTVGSVISDEDVARQLMRLGDASNFSSHGRTSTSTLDDAFSGKAEAASSSDESDGGSDIEEHELPSLPYSMGMGSNDRGELVQAFDSGDTSEEDYEDNNDESFKGESDEIMPDERLTSQPPMTANKIRPPGKILKAGKPRMPSSKSKLKVGGATRAPISPTSLPPQSRKTSSASVNNPNPLGADEEDLSTKPRCQRCRKSKKGCDRQRPCQRCKDAGIGIEGCVSEDEGNGRKGRYGRHMGVPVKKAATETPVAHDAPSAITTSASIFAPSNALEKSKKRKR